MAKKKATRKKPEQGPKTQPAKKNPTRKKSSTKPAASSKSTNSSRRPRKKKAAAAAPPALQLSEPQLGFPIVGIGASAGGLEALLEFLRHTPADSGMAFVIVTHQHPGHCSLLPELLGKETAMPVIVVEDGQSVEPNHVYVTPPGGQLAIFGGALHWMETGQQSAPRLPIDYFFRSLADDQAERSACIILSGTGTDGTQGLKAIKGASGMAMVERPESAKYSGMPAGRCDRGRSAVSPGRTDAKHFCPVTQPHGPRFLGLQEQHAPPPHRTADERTPNPDAQRVPKVPPGELARNRPPVQGVVDQRHELLSRPASLGCARRACR
jgi:chemotaxis response regulator CheB